MIWRSNICGFYLCRLGVLYRLMCCVVHITSIIFCTRPVWIWVNVDWSIWQSYPIVNGVLPTWQSVIGLFKGDWRMKKRIFGGKGPQYLQRVGIGIDHGGNNATSEIETNPRKRRWTRSELDQIRRSKTEERAYIDTSDLYWWYLFCLRERSNLA